MKQIITNILLILVVCCTGCTPTAPYPLAMQQAESCMNTRPDSALHLLQTLEDSVPSFPEETRMYYHLLCIQAKDKQYIDHTDDSLISRIIEFYEGHDDANKLMMAYYYQGSVYRDMNDAPRALKAFQQAVDISTPDNDLLPKAYNQMGSLFMYQGLYDEAIKVNRKNIEFYTKSGKPNKASFALRDIARMYDMKEEPDSALHYYNRACNTALADKDSARYNYILSEMGAYFYQTGKTDLGKQILLNASHQDNINNKVHIYLTLAYIYRDLLQLDSARYYYEKTLEYNILRNNYSSYRSLFALDKTQGKYTQAIKHIEKALALKDSIDYITQTEAVAKINSLYNYQHTEEENALLKLHKEEQRNWILTLSLFSLLVVSLCVYLTLYHKQKRTQILLEQKRKEQLEQEKYANSLAAIQDNEARIAELDTLLSSATKENDLLKQELLQAQKKKLKAQNEEIIQYQKEHQLLLTEFKRSALYKEIWLASNSEDTNLSFYRHPEKWMAIQEHIDAIYPHFTARVKEICPSLSDTELQVCWLTKAGISPSGIARVLNLSKQAITNIRSRLTKKMKIKERNFANFDHFIEKM